MIGLKNKLLIILKLFYARQMENNFSLRNLMILALILQLFLISSCKKVADTQLPVISYISPYELEEFNVLDNIPIKADITDDNIIESLKVGLVDSDLISVAPSIYIYPNSSSYKLDIQYSINGQYLETGEYYIHIRAEDGTNFKNQYQLIKINGIPLEFEKVIVVSKGNFNEINISEIDKADNMKYLFDFAGDYSGSEINSRYQQLYITGRSSINLNSYDLFTQELDWMKETFPPLPMHSNGCLYFQDELYISFNTNYIYGYRHNGSQVFNATVENDKTPSRLAKFNDLLLVDLQSKTGGITYIASYYLATGAQKQRLATNYKVVDFFEIDNNNVLIAGNSLEEGILNLYDPYQNTETSLLPVPGKIVCIEKLTSNNFILSTDNAMLIYDYDHSLLTSIFPGKVAYRIRYDKIENNIYTVSPNLIEKIKYPQMLFQNSFPIQDSIFNIHLLYSK